MSVEVEYEENLGRITRMIRECMANDETIVKIELHNTTGVRDEFILGGEQDHESIDPEQLASSFLNEAHADARAMGGEQKYALSVYFEGRNPKRPQRRFRFTAFERSHGWLNEGGSVQTPGSPGALVEQAQRHTEVAVGSMIRGTDALIKNLMKENQRLSRDNEKLQERIQGMFELQEDLLSLRHQRDLESLQMQKQEERKDEALDMLKIHVPKLFGKAGAFMKGEDVDGLTQGDIDSLSEIIRQLKQEQIMGMMQHLNPGQQAGLMDLVMKVAKASEEPKKVGAGKVKRLPTSKGG